MYASLEINKGYEIYKYMSVQVREYSHISMHIYERMWIEEWQGLPNRYTKRV